jgi:integrase/recombinase XerD
VRLREPSRLPRPLTVGQVAAVVAAQRRLRDRFLFVLLVGTGCGSARRWGCATRTCSPESGRSGWWRARTTATGRAARAAGGPVPVSPGLMRLLNDYMHEEYGALDCDYVFVNLWPGRLGARLRYATVVDIVRRTRRRVGFPLHPPLRCPGRSGLLSELGSSAASVWLFAPCR